MLRRNIALAIIVAAIVLKVGHVVAASAWNSTTNCESVVKFHYHFSRNTIWNSLI